MQTALRPSQFIDADIVGQIRLFGSVENAELICLLYERFRDDPSVEIYLASPKLADGVSRVSEQLQIVTAEPRVAPSLGGWHRMTAIDYQSYQLAVRIPEPDADIRPFAERHPLWAYAQFIPSIDLAWFGRWVGSVRDPRWYIAPAKPHGRAAYVGFLGLHANTQARVLRHGFRVVTDGRWQTAASRCYITQRAWLPNAAALESFDANDPRQFLMRTCARHMVERMSDPEEAKLVGVMRASQQFAIYLRGAWLEVLSVGTNHEGELFDLRDVFTPNEVQAFQDFKTAQTSA